jgi:phytoene dehydrogenase-like protein
MDQAGKTVAIVGAGMAGLCAGVYAQMNGYRSRIYEQHTVPGGLCTAWKRHGYTIDLCIHWLVGSRPGMSMHELWREVGIVQGTEIIDLDEFARVETSGGETVVLYRDLDRTEQHLLELAPADATLIRGFFNDARHLSGKNLRSDLPPQNLMSRLDRLRAMPMLLPYMKPFRTWGKLSIADFADRFSSPALREAFRVWWHPEMSVFTLLMTLVWLHDRQAGYPIGGSAPLARAVERRYLDMGGEIEYGDQVSSVIVERDRAVGLRMSDAGERRADWVISAADGHSTIFDLLEGRYLDETRRHYYRDLARFPSVVFVGLGVNRSFADEPRVVSGWSLPAHPLRALEGVETDRIAVRIHNFDPTLAPTGKTVITVTLEADYDHWVALAAEDSRYEEEKVKIAAAVVELLEKRFPGLSAQLEMVDVATPATIERYTGNWQGSYEGWLPTPETFMTDMPRDLPGLDAFLMAGQWVMPGGGLPSGVMSGRQAVQIMCRKDGLRFHTTTA